MGRVQRRQEDQGGARPEPSPRRSTQFHSSSSDDGLPPSLSSPPAAFHMEAKHEVGDDENDGYPHYQTTYQPAASTPRRASLKPPEKSSVSFAPAEAAGHTSDLPAPFVGHPWTSGLFDCHEHSTNAFMTAFFPCVTFGQIVEILEAGNISCALGSFMYLLMGPALCSQWIIGSTYRTRLRTRFTLVQAPTQDWVAHLFCPYCALCQEFRELRNRGIDPSLGWMGNLAQIQGIQQQVRSAPPINHPMTR